MPNTRGTDTATTMLTGTFRDRESAELAYQSLINRGYTRDEITVLMSDNTRRKHFSTDAASTSKSGGSSGGGGQSGSTNSSGNSGTSSSGTTGAINNALSAAGTLALPGIGVVVAGPLAAGFAGIGSNSSSAGFVGALVGSGIPESISKDYESDIKNGAIVMAVTPRNEMDAQDFDREFKKFRAERVHH